MIHLFIKRSDSDEHNPQNIRIPFAMTEAMTGLENVSKSCFSKLFHFQSHHEQKKKKEKRKRNCTI